MLFHYNIACQIVKFIRQQVNSSSSSTKTRWCPVEWIQLYDVVGLLNERKKKKTKQNFWAKSEVESFDLWFAVYTIHSEKPIEMFIAIVVLYSFNTLSLSHTHTRTLTHTMFSVVITCCALLGSRLCIRILKTRFRQQMPRRIWNGSALIMAQACLWTGLSSRYIHTNTHNVPF